ncbi:unnamed protein product [Cochlearia groenlandica]
MFVSRNNNSPTSERDPLIIGDSSREDHEINKAAHTTKKQRAETWVQDETLILITLRGEMDGLFNAWKSNKHLWEHISTKMMEKGFYRSPTMCTDKWRNMLKDFKKAKYQEKCSNGSGSANRMSYYKEIEDILSERSKTVTLYKSPTTTTTAPSSVAKVDSFMQFTDKGFEDADIYFASVEANGRPELNVERQLDHDGPPLAITSDDAATSTGIHSWNWRETPSNAGGDGQTFVGRIITVKFGDYTRRVGIDGTSEAIKEAIRSVFRLRTRRAFWLEDEEQIVRSLDRDMPLGNYTLHVDEGNLKRLSCFHLNVIFVSMSPNRNTGIAVRVCHYNESDPLPVHQEEKIFYTEEDYRDFLGRRGWTWLREFDGFRNIDNMDDLQPGVLYRGMR